MLMYSSLVHHTHTHTRHIFRHIAADTEGTEYTIKCSFLVRFVGAHRLVLCARTHTHAR